MAYRGPIAYTGIAQPTPPNQVVLNRAPTSQDYQSFNIGDRWVVPYQATSPSEQEWILMSKAQGIATWVEVTAGGSQTFINHELLVGSGTTTINQIPPGTSGQLLVSGGASADPSWVNAGTASSISITGDSGGALTGNAFTFTGGTTGLTFSGAGTTETLGGDLVVANGGTGQSSFTANAPIIAGTSSTAALAQVTTGLNTAGYVLTANSSGAPTFQAASGGSGFSSINVQTFTTTGTYTPTAGMSYCIVETLGAGGGGGGSVGVGGGGAWTGAGAGAGGYCKKVVTAAAVGASKAVTIGAGGAGGSGNATGTTGGATTFGAILTANGGVGGTSGGGSTATTSIIGSAGGTASGGDSNVQGQYGGNGQNFVASPPSVLSLSGNGANSQYGVGGVGIWYAPGASDGNAGIGYGSGGSGSVSGYGGASKTGGTGASGLVIVTEFIA